jgi:thymidylate kinase
MFTVSLIGPDGVGKTTVAKCIESALPLPAKYIYMGLNIREANFSLPTTRIWDAIIRRKLSKNNSSHFHSRHKTQTSASFQNTSLVRQAVLFVRKALGLANLILEEWYRQLVACVYNKFGYIVVFDRHFIYDFYDSDGYDNRGQESVKKKIHDFIRNKTILAPDLVICLDAPSEIVFDRKKEFDIDYLANRRRNYLGLQDIVTNFAIIDANRGLDVVVKDVYDQIIQFQESR